MSMRSDRPSGRLRQGPGSVRSYPEAVALFLRGRGFSEDQAKAATSEFASPLTVTKRGTLVWARK
jgi:hypothetical protein